MQKIATYIAALAAEQTEIDAFAKRVLVGAN